ncbi:TLC domain-containing protein 5-like [Macrosteles quadrilineatus]|uniref:TLC domain-containing protein 5-like n=1 Tax=Macrosteles quadrilineatus TaxID=74068 RepID=UPI0023E147A2|nr:TLC domain-containing protein 5-like [Macrosteles quadrilineatus]
MSSNEFNLSSICLAVTSSAVCWTVMYLCLVRSKVFKQMAEVCCRIVTLVHAVVAVVLSALCYWQGPDPYSYPGEPNTLLQDVTLTVSLGYFWFDLGWCLIHQTEPAIMLLHHLASLVSIGMVLLGRTSGGEAVAGILSLEVTNPLLQIRWFLRTAGYNKSLIHTLVEILFVISFVVVRLGIGSYLTYCVVFNGKPKIAVKCCCFSLYLISLAFVFYIVKFIKKKYVKSKERSSD